MSQAAETIFVLEKRRQRASWQAISNMLGRSVDGVRRDFDPTYMAVHTPVEVAPVKPRALRSFESESYGVKSGERTRQVLDRLYAAKIPISTHEIGGQVAVNIVSDIRRKHGQGLICSRQNVGYWLTEKGRQFYRDKYALVAAE